MGLTSIISRAVPIAVGFATGGPVGAFTATVATEQAKLQEKKIKQENIRLEKEFRNMEIFGPQSPTINTLQRPVVVPATQNAGAGGFVDNVTGFFKGAGDVIKSAFGSGLPQLFGVGTPKGIISQPAITSTSSLGAQETSGSGSIQAGAGAFLQPAMGLARNFLKSPFGQFGIGTAVGGGLSLIGPDGRPMRVTRKMKNQARSLLNMTGGNLSVTADFLGISEEQLVAILLKRFRNDGPVVTKAALRKTKSTIRKLKNMCDMYDDLRPSARRRSPMKRARSSSTTLIKN